MEMELTMLSENKPGAERQISNVFSEMHNVVNKDMETAGKLFSKMKGGKEWVMEVNLVMHV
jgi:hypothetical protein